ncbi:MAG: DegT/DnrJ/EryC1/StrS aminotransferase family protein [Bacteriovorax sp.]|nr:DegT/DnrJ/EryC1/StrS aminotransferase family protein [Bacteriovorax sp.]
MKITKISKAIPRAIYYLSPKTALKSFFQVMTTRFTFKQVSQFEESFAAFVGSKKAIATSHARVALYLVLKTLELDSEAEVLMSGVNLPDMVNMIRLNGLVPRVFDYEERSFNFSLVDLKEKMTTKTKVLFITILAGIDSNIEEVIQLGEEHRLIIIIDQTQSMGLKVGNTLLASKCDFSIYSLCDLKDIHAHRGGVVAFNDPIYELKLRSTLEFISSDPQRKYFLKFIFEDFVSSVLLRRNFFHFFISPFLFLLHCFGKAHVLEDLTKGKGIKFGRINFGRGFWGGDGDLVRTSIPSTLLYRFTALQARLGIKQLLKVHHIQNERILRAELMVTLIKENNSVIDGTKMKTHLFWKFPLWVNEPKKIQRLLQLRGIDCAPTNLPSICSIEAFNSILIDKTPQTEKLISNILFIPVHYYLTLNEIGLIANIINEVLDEK